MMETKLYRTMVNASLANKLNNDKPVSVSHKIPQGMRLNVNINIKAARNIEDLVKPIREKKCTSRSGVSKKRGTLVDLPDELIHKLKKSDAKVMKWISASAQNRDLFILDPIAALQNMDLKLDRKDIKALARVRSSVSKSEAIPPGLTLAGFSSKVDIKGGNKPTTGHATKLKECPPGKTKTRTKGGK